MPVPAEAARNAAQARGAHSALRTDPTRAVKAQAAMTTAPMLPLPPVEAAAKSAMTPSPAH